MSLRERFKAIIRQRTGKLGRDTAWEEGFLDALVLAVEEARPPGVSCSKCCQAPASLCSPCYEAVLKARPEPSREALPAILGGHCSHIEGLDQLFDKLMAWTRGETQTPVWCPHIYRQGQDWKSCPDDRIVAHFWDICPVAGCHAPRPAEPT